MPTFSFIAPPPPLLVSPSDATAPPCPVAAPAALASELGDLVPQAAARPSPVPEELWSLRTSWCSPNAATAVVVAAPVVALVVWEAPNPVEALLLPPLYVDTQTRTLYVRGRGGESTHCARFERPRGAHRARLV